MSKPIALFGKRDEASGGELAMDEMPAAVAEAEEGGGAVARARRRGRPSAATVQSTTSATVLAERSVVGAVLNDNTLYDVVIDITRVEDFSDSAAAAAFAAIGDIIEGRADGITTADPIALASLPSVGQVVSVETLAEWRSSAVVDAEVVASHAKVVCNAAAERNLGAAVSQAQNILKEGLPIEERANNIQQALTLATEVRALPVVSLGAAAVAALTEMAERANRGDNGIGMTTGFDDLDALLAGLHGGQLIVVAARPGIGKTAFAMSLGLGTAAAGYPTLMASMEMKAKELSKRALAIESGVDSHAIRIGALSESDWEAVVTAGEYLNGIPFDVVDLPSVNLTALSNLARRLHRAGKLKLLIVDYLQIMETTSKKNGTREQEVSALSRGLKKLAMQLDIPVIALSQLNRSVENRIDRRPKMSDLRESGGIEQDADVIMFIHRETAADGSTSLEETAEVIVEKQREGPTGVVSLGYAKRNTRFYNLTAPAYGAERVLAVA